MKIELLVPGRIEPASRATSRGGPSGTELEPRVTDLLDDVTVVSAFSLSPSARARSDVEKISVEHDDILEIEVDGGFTLWTSVARYHADQQALRPATERGAAVDFSLIPRPREAERGAGEWFASALRVLRLRDESLANEVADPTRWAEFAQEFGLDKVAQAGAWVTTKFLIWLIERRLPHAEGLYRWADATRSPSDKTPVATASFTGVDPEQPILVFIHGTASTTLGSFGALLDANPGAQSDWTTLSDAFGGQLYAYEHRTLSASPIENALRLARSLPDGARVSLITHSRGGLIGDLLCLRDVPAALIESVRRPSPAFAEADAHDRRKLQELLAVLASKKFRIGRYLRCACPARGTLLASENTDQFLSVLTNLVGLIPGLAGSPLYEVVKRVTLQVAKNRWQPALLPGIEAMTPPSPLVRFLNAQLAQAQGELGVIAGDIEGGHWLKRLGVFLTDQFIYESRDNDLVVNTDSMFNGAPRAQTRYVFDQGGDVTHFNYFRNDRTRSSMLHWVTARDEAMPSEFKPLASAEFTPVPMERSIMPREGAALPIVILLPGVMGSQLNVDDAQVWLDFSRLATGGLSALSDPAATHVSPTALLGEYYADLRGYLSETHEVLAFAYDWRRSIVDSAALLAERVELALGRSSQPVRLLAHGMGGLVVRQMIKDRPELWDQVCERDGARFVMLGTPNRGSHAMVDALLGTSATIQRLALLDLSRDRSGVTELIQRFPGLLQLLPLSDDGRYFERSTWDTLRAGWAMAAQPAAAHLAAARAVLAGLPDQLPHADRVLYIAGTASQTVDGIDLVDGQIILRTTTEGDGNVTYDSGRLPGVLTWYMPVEHGDLTAYRDGFGAISDLLTRGGTSRLPSSPPSAARGGAASARMLPQPVLYPTPEELSAGLLGKRRSAPHRPRPIQGFRVSVVHGDLRFARFPILVGHYEGDTIVGAEARIDQLLDSALTTRYNLGLYPGATGTVSVVIRPPTPLARALKLPSGAVVIGLGRWGELTAAQLSNLIRRAALYYVLQLDDNSADGAVADGDPIGLTLLLIGTTSTANISTDDSVGAILRGIVQANRELAKRVKGSRCIDEIEIVEVYADTAIEAARAVRRLSTQLSDELDTRIEAAPILARGRDGRSRLTPVQGRDPWRRWEISVVESADPAPLRLPAPLLESLKRAVRDSVADPEVATALTDMALASGAQRPPDRAIKFVSLSDRARAEVMHQQRQPELIDRLIQASITHTEFRQQEARALFELLVPNDLKDGLAQLSRVIFVVDAETAQYPWELMSDGGEPLATRMGFVRQLKTARYRAHIRATTARTAYVVGDPLVSAPFSQLIGARQEAQLVAGLLNGRFEPTWRDERLSALDVLGGLFERPYRIIHLAGHGYYAGPTAGSNGRSGMVLDNGVFLTAVEIGQMQQVPELVFLNCCYIGQVGPEAPAGGSGVEYNRLAASIARELIEMGVRAVVAAGWAVRDDAALHFSRVFYEQMLDGRGFGRALQEARAQTWRRFPGCNTWGAYQAYGDPDFRLEPEVVSSGANNLRDCVAPAELINVLRESSQVASDEGSDKRRDSSRSKPAIAQRITAMLKDCPREWLGRSDILVELGLAYGRLAQFDDAVRYLSAALESEELDSVTTLTAVEQLANFEARRGEKQATADGAPKEEKETGIARINSAISKLESLSKLGRTAERLALIAGSYKRLALAHTDPRQVRRALEESARHYREAHELNASHGRFNSYPVLNWITLDTLLERPVANANELLTRVEAAARERFAMTKDFFDAAAPAEATLVRALRDKRLAATADVAAPERDRIAGLYEQAIQLACARPAQVDSVTSQIRLLERIPRLLGTPSDAASERTGAMLAALQARLGGKAQPSPSPEGARAPRAATRTKPPSATKKAAKAPAAKRVARRRTSGISG